MSHTIRRFEPADRDRVAAFVATLDEHDLLFLGRDLRHPRVIEAWLDAIGEGWIDSLIAEDLDADGHPVVGTAALVRDPLGAVYCHRHPDGGWLPGGASSTGAGVLGGLFPDAGPAGLARLTGQARRLAPVGGATYPLAGQGERFPFVAPSARGFTSPRATTPAEVFSAVCHGLAFVERLAYDVLGSLGAERPHDAARHLVAVLDGFALQRIARPRADDREALRTAVRLVAHHYCRRRSTPGEPGSAGSRVVPQWPS